jgi:AhpC/TSA antioxidant enzyme
MPSSSSPPESTASTKSKRSSTEAQEHRLPTNDILKKAGEHILYDSAGYKIPFRSLYTQGKRRTLILFIRHFFCGNCQEYLRSLAKSIPASSLPSDLDIKIIGCGSHTLITSYIEQLACSPPFPYSIYAEPTKKLYELLGMHYTLSLGTKSPEYIHRSLVRVNLASAVQGIKRIWSGDALSGGDMRLNGGEFLFENTDSGKANVIWCHRMSNSRDHAEIDTLRKALKLDQPAVAEPEAERPGLGRRRSTADRLRRSFSSRRQSLLGRAASLSRSRDRKENSRETCKRRSQANNIDVVREELRSRDGEEKPVTAAMNGGIDGVKVST